MFPLLNLPAAVHIGGIGVADNERAEIRVCFLYSFGVVRALICISMYYCDLIAIFIYFNSVYGALNIINTTIRSRIYSLFMYLYTRMYNNI